MIFIVTQNRNEKFPLHHWEIKPIVPLWWEDGTFPNPRHYTRKKKFNGCLENAVFESKKKLLTSPKQCFTEATENREICILNCKTNIHRYLQ